MPNLILDTCALIWLAEGSDYLSKEARRRIDDAFVVYVSPISLWEIARKVAKGKLKLPLGPVEWFDRVKQHHNLTLLPFTETVAFKAATLPEIHKDPSDRFIVASAMENNLVIVTADRIIQQYAIECIC
jgi:PIN domain nuclease of toxin-antitoxin system